jgi:hypothetical protein
VDWDNLSRLEKVATDDADVVLYPQVLNHVQFQGHLCVVLVGDTTRHRKAGLFSTARHLDALPIYRYSQARFHLELLFRDATQFAGLTACQARSPAKRHFHCNASLSAVTLAKLDARQHNGGAASGVSMASLTRRAFNQHLLERISQYLAKGQSVEKSSPDYEALCNYGTLTETAA